LSKGTHIIIDCYNVSSEICLDDRRLLEIAIEAVSIGGATIINTSRYHFGHNSPPGCTVFVMLDESHLSIHTYADDGKMAIDVFTCGQANARVMVDFLKTQLQLTHCTEKIIERF
jgi:S-adenosylmethionine decarboxylase proenzyme